MNMRYAVSVVLVAALMTSSAVAQDARDREGLGTRVEAAGMEGDGAGPLSSRVKPVAISEAASPIRTLDAKSCDGN